MSQIISIVVSKISDNVECILYGENWCFCPKIVDFDVSKIAMWNGLNVVCARNCDITKLIVPQGLLFRVGDQVHANGIHGGTNFFGL